ncbi:hypothetical protein Amir_0286 [Actinosynnema mirum DSM 43827]|uniref:Uncharacterized protein n=1 Tax=Actinosynnema mirum (strain ATCC 29888 / DSM 43827 / JCM 3225 / NBRC 14064 / NCIMB 13271 / NRRL B-12336 / IMRU 3971 / 101) TaxID=446462 RepID=C6WFC3_ACTMD|nr:hypothetical protein Amir_0286 [Actinosynnema mirum DSM 43827]AXX27630.1 hypothetical protein APASM_0265 [Actinosynnema pretiosum subsp. pretiosum]
MTGSTPVFELADDPVLKPTPPDRAAVDRAPAERASVLEG